MSTKCLKCGFERRLKLTIEEFKKTTKVGDVIYGYPTKIQARITAIGEQRFLYINMHSGKECVGTITSDTANWRRNP